MNEELKREELENVTGGFETKDGDHSLDVSGKSLQQIGGGVGEKRTGSRREGQDDSAGRG